MHAWCQASCQALCEHWATVVTQNSLSGLAAVGEVHSSPCNYNHIMCCKQQSSAPRAAKVGLAGRHEELRQAAGSWRPLEWCLMRLGDSSPHKVNTLPCARTQAWIPQTTGEHRAPGPGCIMSSRALLLSLSLSVLLILKERELCWCKKPQRQIEKKKKCVV